MVTLRAGGEATVHIVLRHGGWIEGRVLEEDRTPVAGARIELAATHGSLERIAYTADDGTFTFAAAPGEVLLSIARPTAPADVVARIVVDVPDRDRREVEIVTPQGARHRGDPRRRRSRLPGRSRRVRAVSLQLDEPLRRTLFTDASGDTELPDAVGLPLRITLQRPGKAPVVTSIESAPAKLELTLNEALKAHGTITGRDGRDRIEGAEITLFTARAPATRAPTPRAPTRWTISRRAACASPSPPPSTRPPRWWCKPTATAITRPISAPSIWTSPARSRARSSTPKTSPWPAPASATTASPPTILGRSRAGSWPRTTTATSPSAAGLRAR